MRNGSTRGGSYSIRCGVKAGIHGSVGGPVSENDDVAGEPDGESRGGGGVGCLERVIPLGPYVPNPLIDNFRTDYQEPLPGALFETYVAHNLFAIIDTRWKEAQLYFWGIQGRNEVDCIIEVGRNCLAIEVKSSARWQKKTCQDWRLSLQPRLIQ